MVNLENLIDSTGAAIPTNNKVPPIEEYIVSFKKRYRSEKTFKSIVHQYLELTAVQAVSLQIGKIFRPSWYEKKSEQMIEEYAKKIRENAVKALEIQTNLAEYKSKLAKLESTERELATEREEAEKKAEEKRKIEQAKRQEEEKAVRDAQEKIKKEHMEYSQEAGEIERETNAAEIVKKTLCDRIVGSGIVTFDKVGNLSYNEELLVTKLEDMFLDETLATANLPGGKEGFLKTTRLLYKDVFSHFAELEDIDELPNVDWIQSIILSRMHGYASPQFPYLVAAKFIEGVSKGKSTVDSALAIDKSGSMSENNKIVIARQATLATSALMRKLNPKNKTSISAWSDYLKPVSSLELLREVRPNGGTNTAMALDWLVDTLGNGGLGIAYLATDGLPTCSMYSCIKAASRFQEFPNLALRIFLIDGNYEAKGIIKQIGKAAGPNTKVIPLDNYNLPGGMIKEVPDILRGMYSMTENF